MQLRRLRRWRRTTIVFILCIHTHTHTRCLRTWSPISIFFFFYSPPTSHRHSACRLIYIYALQCTHLLSKTIAAGPLITLNNTNKPMRNYNTYYAHTVRLYVSVYVPIVRYTITVYDLRRRRKHIVDTNFLFLSECSLNIIIQRTRCKNVGTGIIGEPTTYYYKISYYRIYV